MPAYQSVVVGVHDDPAGARVVELAGVLGAETGATLILVTAYQSKGSRPAELTLTRAAQTCAEIGAPTVQTFAVAGDPTTVLNDAARDQRADLLIVGNHGLSTVGGRLAGSVPGGVIGKAGCDVLIVHNSTDRWHKLVSRHHHHEPSTRPRTFLVGVHDTAHSMRAAEKAGELAADLDAELVLVGGYERAEEWILSDDLSHIDSQHRLPGRRPGDHRHDALVNGEARARAKGARKVSTVAVPDYPVHGLLEIADQRNADLVVVGNHPQARGLARLIGSISTQVSRKAPVHVLLVR